MMPLLGFLQFTILLSAFCLSSVQTDCPSLNSERNSFYINSDVIYDHLLAHSTFLVTTTFNEVECFKQCLHNCSCLSMNYLKGGQQNNCLLNNSTKEMNPDLLQFRASWKYYHFVRENTGNSDTGCLNTCCEKNPCLHGGTCTELCANQRRRFQCKCKGLYTGHRCEMIFKPRSCADLKKHGITKNECNNIYITPNSPGTLVYCDLRSRNNITWTLTTSFYTDILDFGYFICMNRIFHHSHFYHHNLGTSERRVLRNQSTHWRATCEYDKHHRVLDNYIVAKLDQIDLTASWPDGVRLCKRFELINVMNTTCTNCTATVISDCTRGWYFLLLGTNSTIPSCTENVTLNERYFGSSYYHDNSLKINPLFPCYQYLSSTIQFWFGSV